MEKIIFDAGFNSFFASHKLHAFDDFFEFAKGQTINENAKRNVIVLKLEDNGRIRTFYMKRFIKPYFKDILSTVWSFGTLCSQAEVEWRNARILLDNGIETYHPACYGVRSCCGIEKQSFFMTEQINGACLSDYLVESWAALQEAEKQELVIRLGRFFQKIHASRIALPDAYIWHIYRIQSTDAADNYQLGIIDLHRMKIRTYGNRPAAKDLGAFLFSLPDGFMDEALRSLFMNSYLSDGRIPNPNAFRQTVKQWKQKIAARRPRELDRI